METKRGVAVVTDSTSFLVAVVDTNAGESAGNICKQISHANKPVEIFRCGLSPVVGTYGGPGTTGVALLDTRKMQVS